MRKDKNKKENQGFNITHGNISYIVIVFSLIVSISLVIISLTYRKESNIIHHCYILSPGEYIVQEEVITPASADGSVEEQKQSFFKFTFEDKLYRFEYDQSYLHDGNLYFCEKHGTLE